MSAVLGAPVNLASSYDERDDFGFEIADFPISMTDLKKSYLSLSPSQKKALLKQLSCSEKTTLVAIFTKPSKVHFEHLDALQANIQAMQSKKIIVKLNPDQRISKLYYFQRFIISFFKKILHLTDAYDVIRQASMQKTASSSVSSMNTSKMKGLLEQARAKSRPFAEILHTNGYSHELVDLDFVNMNFSDIKLDGITFINCQFKECQFKNIESENLTFMNSTLDSCHFTKANFTGLQLVNSELFSSTFVGAKITNSNLTSSDLFQCSFEEANLIGVDFKNVALRGSHFLQAEAVNSTITESNLEDVILFDLDVAICALSKETHKITSTVSTLLYTPDARGITTPKVYQKLAHEVGSIPLRVSFNIQGLNKESFNELIDNTLTSLIKEGVEKSDLASTLIDRLQTSEDPIVAKIFAKASLLSKYTNLILLPGGEDIPPALYGSKQHQATAWGDSYGRSILELALIRAGRNRGVPLVGICRGFQMLAVYHGAELNQDVTGQKGLQTLSLSPQVKSFSLAPSTESDDNLNFFEDAEIVDLQTSSLSPVFSKPLVSAVFHHQAVEAISEQSELAVSVVADGYVKAIESKLPANVPTFGLQFHPEFLGAATAHSMTREMVDRGLNTSMSRDNDKFWQLLVEVSQQHAEKKAANMELKNLRIS